ncbi:MAG TPA: peptidyl-prolyl cis-trans isomerase [Steroidobacteraceae bacterium]|jgi:parvulin-like peptidyl-prolyl isomerase|nr:peptidyl-prolyl cis-trans isomerase [Steroidobacteraceae bacterium]
MRAWSFSPRRGLALPLAGIAVGLIAAGAAVFRKAPHPITRVPEGYVALVNQQGILMSDFISQTATEMEEPFEQTTAAQRRKVLREMIDKELLVQRAQLLDLPETTIEVRTVMAEAVDAQAAAPMLAQQPTEAQLRAYYEAHQSRYSTEGTMTVRNLVLHVGGYQNADQSVAQAEADAVEAVYQLRSGATVDYVMEHFGFVDADPQYDTQQLDFAAKIHLGSKLYATAQGMSGGQVSDPIVDTDGVHVLVMQQRTPPVPADFPTARSQVYTEYQQERARLAQQRNLQYLRRQAQILLAAGQSE